MSDTIDRRRFVQTVGGVGIGAIGSFVAADSVQAGQTRTAPQRPAGTDDFPKPAGLRAGAQLDSRFPVSFSTPVSEGMRLMVEYFTALSQRDVAAIARTLHFPFAIYEDIEPIVIQSAADFVAAPPQSLNPGSGKSRIMPRSYDLLEGINIHLYCPVGAAFSLSFTRYTPDGYKLLVSDGVYSVTNNDGRWAIQLASTIVREADFIGVTYPDAEAAATRAEQNYLAAFGYGNEAILNDPKTSRGTYEPPFPVGTRTASVNFGYGPRERSRDARENHPMSGWKTTGVKNRLVVATRSEETANRTIDTNLAEFNALAGGSVGTYAYTRDRPVRPVTIHATHDKAHILNGYFRYTADGTLISETRSVGIRIYKAGHWGSAGSLGQVTHHDRSNSKA
jgi:hypothetical protein